MSAGRFPWQPLGHIGKDAASGLTLKVEHRKASKKPWAWCVFGPDYAVRESGTADTPSAAKGAARKALEKLTAKASEKGERL